MDEADMLLDESFTEVLTNIFSVVPVANSITNPVNKDTGIIILKEILFSSVYNNEFYPGARIIFCSASCPEELECLAEGIVDRASLSYVKSPKLHTLLPNLEMKFIRYVHKIEGIRCNTDADESVV
uniref:Helicase ATP-binding domain-containing protein n=1 Tax=Heterorhabditis bacteriophora TaxID=37862 RepID=A0A1I7XFA9_HETBA